MKILRRLCAPRGERVRRTLDRHPAPRTPRPHHHLEPSPAQQACSRLHRSLQHAPTPPLARPATSPTHHPRQQHDWTPVGPSTRPNDPLRWPHQRIQTGRLTSHDTILGTHRVGSADLVPRLNASANSAESTYLGARSTPGTYYYGACVDSVPGESGTQNNCSAAVTVTVGAAPPPDLVVDTPTVSDSSPTAGASFTLSATVRNQGNGPSASTTLRYYRSTDATITAGDTAAGTDSVSRLGAQESGAESISLTAPPTPGTYYYGACADTESGESDTYNNCSDSVQVTVSAPVVTVVRVNNVECGGVDLGHAGSGPYSYTVTGEVHTNRDIERMQVGYGIGYFQDEFGLKRYVGPLGASASLSSMSADESKSFEFAWIEFTRRTACSVVVVWIERP